MRSGPNTIQDICLFFVGLEGIGTMAPKQSDWFDSRGRRGQVGIRRGGLVVGSWGHVKVINVVGPQPAGIRVIERVLGLGKCLS